MIQKSENFEQGFFHHQAWPKGEFWIKSDDSLRQVSSASERECVEVRKALEEPTSTKRKKYLKGTNFRGN